MNSKAKNTTEYISHFPKWKGQLQAAQKVLESSQLVATIKWGAPCYTYKGKNLIGLAGFKNHCAIWFHKGSFLKDKVGAFENAQPDKTKFLRQLRYCENDTVDTLLLKNYIEEAIAIEELEPVIKKKSTAPKNVIIPNELQAVLNKNSDLQTAFNKLTPPVRREYCEHVVKAKRETTKLSRIVKITPLIMEGKSLYDKYKK